MKLSNGPLYSLLALYMPLAILTALVFLLRMFLPISTAPLLISGIVGALSASFYCDFMKEKKSGHTADNIRAAAIVLIISYGISTWKERFLPNLTTVFAFFGTLYVWVGVIALKQLFSARKRFEAYTELYRGEQLHEALFEDQYLLQDIDERIFRTQRNYLLQFAIVGIMLLVNMVYKIHLPLPLYVLLIGILASGICIFGFFGVIRKEHYCAAKGMSLSPRDRARHLLWIGVFSGGSIVAAIVLSSDKSLLPASLVADFFNWLFVLVLWGLRWILMFLGLLWGLLGGESETAPEPMAAEPFPSFPVQAEKSDPLPIWTLLQYGFIILAVAGFIWFMIAPLLNRTKAFPKGMSFFRKLAALIGEWLRGIQTGLVSFFVFIKNGGTTRKLPRHDAEAIRQMAGAVLGAYSRAKKHAVRHSVTLFARLIIWGGEVRQVIWKPVHAPGEYCRLLVEAFPADNQLNRGIIRCGELFEKALYSAELLSDEERKEFKCLVEEITLVV